MMDVLQKRQRRRALNERLKARVPNWYRPILHLLGSFVLTASLVWIFVGQLRAAHVHWWAWLAFPVALFVGNVIEYLIHRYPMHKRTRLFDRFFRSHTLVHHRVFDQNDFEIEGRRDVYFVLTTVHTTVLTVGVLGATYLLLRAAVGVDLAAVTCIGFATYAFAVEAAHLVLHLPDHVFERWPLGSRLGHYLREHHRIHHDPKLMTKYNFNLAFPVTDFLVGTRYVDPTPTVDAEAVTETP